MLADVVAPTTSAATALGRLRHRAAGLDEAVRLAPKSVNALNGRGFAYKQKGDLDRAIADLNEVIRLEPKITPAHTNRGLALEEMGDRERADAALSIAARTERVPLIGD